jgi:glycosyltransferase involved in cell wall biosynthesis
MGHGHSLLADVRIAPLAYFLLPLYLIAGTRELIRLTQEQSSDVIHVHWVLPNGLIAAWVSAYRNIPFIVSLHGSDVYLARKYRLFGAVARYIFEKASGLTACSPELLDAAIQLGAPPNSILLPYGVDPEKFHPRFRDITLREKYGQPGEILLISAGRLVHKKGFDTLVSAMPDIIKEFPNVRLLIAGEGPLKHNLIQQAATLGVNNKVRFIGNLPWDQIPAFMASADIFILPSVKDRFGNVDGLPNVLLEAMSSGTAVISSDIPGAMILVRNGINGISYHAGDVQDLCKSVIRLLKNPQERNRLATNARKLIEEEFTWEIVGKKLATYIRDCVAK